MTDAWKEISSKKFDLSDEEDAEYFERLCKINPKSLRDHLSEVIETVNKAEFDLAGWARFKFALLKDQKTWPCEMFKWDLFKTSKEGTIKFKIGIENDLLEDNSHQYYTIYMAIENIWGLDAIESENLPSVWPILDQIDSIESGDLPSI